MKTLAVLLLIACLISMGGGWLFPKLRAVDLVASVVLVGVVAWVIWWGLLFFQIVRLDPILRHLNITPLGTFTRPLIFLGPPIVAAAAFAVVALMRRGWLGR
jgi:hypothetical protein